MRGQGRLDSFSSILAGVAHRLGLESRLFEARLRRQWPDIVGEPIAAHTRPDQIRFKKLYVLVHNSVWLQQLTFLKPVLLEKVNAMAGQPLVTDIVLRIGEFTTDPSPTAEATTAPDPLTIQPSPQLLQEVTLHAQDIQDQALREHLVTLMAQALSQPERPPRSARRSP